ncbi:MAG TPA: hypothetical protein VJ302_17870 [Blastocatellia bacterium]|nr:hypothetical protein [Blastocatellia bacterium]
MTGPFGGDVTAMATDPRLPDRILLGTSDGQIFNSVDGGQVWKRLRPGIKAAGFTVTVILFDRENPQVIYAGVKAVTASGEKTWGGSVFVTEDGGENWREFEGMRGRAVRGLVQSSKDPKVLAAAALDGIYRTSDRGQTWELITPANDPELRGFHSVAIDPRDEQIIYAGTNHLPWKTLDGGKSWKRAGSKETGMIDDSDIFAIHIDETNPETVLMSACSGIYRSLDASAKWSKIQGIPYTSRRTHVIYQHPTRPDVIFAGTTEGLWLSTDHGKPDSWRRVTSLRLVINAIAIQPERPDRVFLGTEDYGVLISNDGGETYDRSNAGFTNRQIRAVLADQRTPGRVYAGLIFDGAAGGFFMSEDGGLSWQQSMEGMGVRDVYSIFQPRATPETIYAGTNHGLFRSDDQGRNWAAVRKEEFKDETRRPESARRVEPIVQTRTKGSRKAPAQPRKRPATGDGKQARANTRNRPAPVEPESPPPAQRPRTAGAVDLQNQVFALASFTPLHETEDSSAPPPSEWLLASTWDGLFRTDDEKKGWLPIRLRPAQDSYGAPLRQPRINAIATSTHAPGLILAGTEEGLFVSRDNGATFSTLTLEDKTRRIRSIALDPRTAQTIYIGTSTGLFRSTDGGRTWDNPGGGIPHLTDVSAIAINTLNPDELYVGDDLRGSFYFSKDRGKTWDQLDVSQLPSTRIGSLISDPFNPNRLYAGSFSGGVYVMSRR